MHRAVKLLLLLAMPAIGVAAAAAVTAMDPPQELKSRLLPDSFALPEAAQQALPSQPDVEPLSSEQFSILLCGIDNTKTLADVILYARLDTARNKAVLLQIPRDVYVGEQYTTGKINSVCLPFERSNPAAQIKEIVEGQFGLEVDGCVCITLAGVRSLVDAVGGVPVDLPQEIDYLPGQTLPAGPQTLTGEQAEWLLRYRKGYEMADLGRLEAQKLFLAGAFDAAKGVGRLRALQIAAQNYGHLKTDLPLSTASSLISAGMSLDFDDVTMLTIPTYGAQYNGYSVLCVSRFDYAGLLNEHLFTDEPVSPWELYLRYPPEPQSQPPSAEEGDGLFDFSWDEPEEYGDWQDSEGIVLRGQQTTSSREDKQ